jgi:hypothetical protein
MESTEARGADIEGFVEASEAYERRLNLGASPVVASAASAFIPGAGQLYNRQVWKGLGYFAVVSALVSTSVITASDERLFDGWPMFGVTLWGASVADAAYHVHRREEKRPRRGGQLSFGTTYGGTLLPSRLGMSADVMLREGLSVGLDDVGITPGPDGGVEMGGGPRLLLAHEGEDLRPAVFFGVGVRHGRPNAESPTITRATFAAGGQLRAYVVPRYFLEGELRYERDGLGSFVAMGIGMGIHLGR